MPAPNRPKMWPPVVALVVSSLLGGWFLGAELYALGFVGLIAAVAAIVWVARRAVRRSQRSAGGKFGTSIGAALGATVLAFLLLGFGTGMGSVATGGSAAPSSGVGVDGSGSGSSNGSGSGSGSSNGSGSGSVAQQPTEFAAISEREFSKVVANPDEHKDEALVIYGKVTQFDSRTGATNLRADTGGERVRASSASGYVSYPHNSILNGTESVLKGLAAHDVFEAHVTVTSGSSYKSQANFDLTAPNFEVHSIKIIGGENAEPVQGTRGTPTAIGNLSFTVSDVKSAKTLKSSYDSVSGDFVLVSLTFENQGKEAFTLDDGHLNLVEADGTSYRPLDTTYRWIDDDISYERVNPKSAFKGRLIFEQPAGVSMEQLSLEVTDGSQRGLISLVD